MPFGRRWFGRGGGWGRGRGNPYPFCRNFPWLPRRWWTMPGAGYYGTSGPYAGYAHPYSGYSGYGQPYGYPRW